jgi:hypothetical protein
MAANQAIGAIACFLGKISNPLFSFTFLKVNHPEIPKTPTGDMSRGPGGRRNFHCAQLERAGR